MSRSKRLNMVLDIAERAENKAAEAFEMARKLWLEDQEKMVDLQRYYQDYETAFAQPKRLRAQDIVQQRSFLQQLAEAVRQQAQVVERRRSIADNKQMDWRTAHLKRRALQELVARVQADEQRILSRKEEKMLDEWFNQTAIRRAESERH
ncbi:MAG: flagellar export protein FliJ [Cellvibrionaceae bacterium]|nr:flagellar export protein FliJ [Cellvibrionaceae bacterium]